MFYIPTIPPDMKDEIQIDLYILREPYYLPNIPDLTDDVIIEGEEGEFIKLTCFINDWIKEAADLFNIILGYFAENFRRVRLEKKCESTGEEDCPRRNGHRR